MADTFNFLNLEGLARYDVKIKDFINTKVTEGDASSFKAVAIDGNVLKFYRVDPITAGATAAYEVALPQQDLDHFMQLVENAKKGNIASFGDNGQVVDGGLAVADIATKADVKTVSDKADANTTEIEKINNATTGILKQAKDYADTKDNAITAAQTAADQAQATADENKTYMGVIPETATATDLVGYIQEKTSGIATNDNLAELTGRVEQAETDIATVKGDYLKKADKDALVADIQANTDAIEVLNGDKSVDGSVDKKVADAINTFATQITNDNTINTYKEVLNYISTHGGEADAMMAAIDELEALVGEKSVATQIAEAITKENLSQYATDAELAEAIARIVVVEGKAHEHANKTELDKIKSGDVDKWNTAYDKVHTHTNKAELDKIASGDVEKWNAIESNTKAYADEQVAQVLKDAQDYADSKVSGVDLSGIATNAADIDKLEASLAEGGATANAIKDAKKAGTDAQTSVNTLAGKIGTVTGTKTVVQMIEDSNSAINTLTSTHNTDKASLQAGIDENAEAIAAIQPIPNSDIDALFA